MCIATPITVNAFLIDVSYSRATFSLEMLGSEQAIEDRVAHIKVQLSLLANVYCHPITFNAFVIDVATVEPVRIGTGR